MPNVLINQSQVRGLLTTLENLDNSIDTKIAAQYILDAAEFETKTVVQNKIDAIPKVIQGSGVTITTAENGVDKIISVGDIELFKIVEELPEEGLINKIYMVVPDEESSDEKNIFAEYVWLPNPDFDDGEAVSETNSKGRWEATGQLTIKLDAYAKTVDVTAAISDAIASALITAAATATEIAQDIADTKIITVDLNGDIVDEALVPDGTVTLAQGGVDLIDNLATSDYVNTIAVAKSTAAKNDAVTIAAGDATSKANAEHVTAVIDSDGIVTLKRGTTSPAAIENADSLASTDYVDAAAAAAAADAATTKDVTATITEAGIVTLNKNNTTITNATSLATKKYVDDNDIVTLEAAEDYADGVGIAKDVTATIANDIVTLQKNENDITNATSLATKKYVDDNDTATLNSAAADATSKANAKDITATIANDIVTLQKNENDVVNATSLATKKYVDDNDATTLTAAKDYADDIGDAKDITAVITNDIVKLQKNEDDITNATSLTTKKYVDEHDAATLTAAEDYADSVGEDKDITATVDSNGIISLLKNEEEVLNATNIASTDYADDVAEAAKDAAIAAIPTHLPNPYKLKMGETEYDGSEAIEIPLSSQQMVDLSGQIDGEATVFTLTDSQIVHGNANVWLNGVRLLESVEYVLAESTLEVLRPVAAVDRLWITYFTGQMSTAFASIEQGYRADTAVQPGQLSTAVDAAVQAAIDAVTDGAGTALDTLKELSAAIGNDADFAGTITAALSTKLEDENESVAKSNLSSAVQTSLGLADTAVQPGALSSAVSGLQTQIDDIESNGVTAVVTGTVNGTLSVKDGDADAVDVVVKGLEATNTKNQVFATSATSNNTAPAMRSLVADDIPTLNQNTTGSAGSILAANRSTELEAMITARTADTVRTDLGLNDKQDTLTTDQLAAVNSGATTAKISGTETHKTDTDIHVTTENKSTWNAKQAALDVDQLAAVNSGITSTLVSKISEVKVNTNDKVLTYNEEDGILANLSLTYTAATGELKLVGKNSTVITTIDLPLEQILESSSFNASTKILTLNFNDASAATQVDLTSLIDTYTAGSGLDLDDDGEFSVKIDSTSTTGVASVSASGLKINLPTASTSAAGIIQIGTGATNAMAGNTTIPELEGTTAPVGSTYGGTSNRGTATTASKSDHKHALPALPISSTSAAGIIQIGTSADQAMAGNTTIPALATTDPTASTYGGVAAAGSATTSSKSDHKHALAALPVASTSAAGIIQIGTGAAQAMAGNTAIPTAGTTASTQAFGDTAAGGSATTWSKSDHKHAMPAAPTTITGNAGTATTLATTRALNVAAVTLSSTSAGAGVNFNGSAAVTLPTPGVTGTLGLGNGGTGATSAAAARTNLAAITGGTAITEIQVVTSLPADAASHPTILYLVK